MCAPCRSCLLTCNVSKELFRADPAQAMRTALGAYVSEVSSALRGQVEEQAVKDMNKAAQRYDRFCRPIARQGALASMQAPPCRLAPITVVSARKVDCSL
eukprot:m.261064 g.261064  ORF g.261064 m.261064 type:complete len:100 (+) comp54607_c3_seq28:371-670(+)